MRPRAREAGTVQPHRLGTQHRHGLSRAPSHGAPPTLLRFPRGHRGEARQEPEFRGSQERFYSRLESQYKGEGACLARS